MHLRLRIFVASFLALASLSVASAMTEAPRVAMIEPPSSLLDAMGVALSPWGLRVVPISAPPPATTDVATASSAARVIAHDHNAAVVLWIATPTGGEPSLWLYEAQTEQISVRPLPQAPPFDDAAAAAVALTVKTLLRSTTVAPPKERLAPAASASALLSASPSASAASTPPDAASGAATATARPAPTGLGRPPSEAPAHALRAEASVLAHLPSGTRNDVVPRAGLSVAYWPRPWRERVGFGAGVKAGVNEEVSGATFTGSLSDTVFDLSARGMLEREPFSVELALGPSLHVTSLSGVVTGGGSASVQRGNPALDASLVPQISLGARVRVGLFVGASVLLRTQRYTVGQDLVLKLPQVGFDLGGRASLALD